MERHTHLRLHYLKALENGALEDLPSPVQGRGMLSNYAAFLGMDADPLLLRFADGLQARLKLRRDALRRIEPGTAATARRVRRPGPLQRFFYGDLLVGAFLVIFLVGFVGWMALRVSQVQSGQQPSPTSLSVADALALDTMTPLPDAANTPSGAEQSPTAASERIAVEATPTLELTPTFPVVESSKIQLYLVARQRAWVRVIVDGKVEMEGRVVPGSAYLFNADERVELLTGNGAALQVFLNRQDLGPLGIFGEVALRVFTLDGMQTPTPAVSPTSLPQPSPTPTPTGTPATGTPTATPISP